VRDLLILGREKDPFPTNPKNDKNSFGWSWRRKKVPSPLKRGAPSLRSR
jgi:hypothetical protein